MTVAVIPARGGSKRIPRKNIRLFHGRPMIEWSIEAARQAGCFERILVSTDDPDIATVARQAGAETPFVRPPELADDHATTLDVMQHAADWLVTNHGPSTHLCCIYATAPFITTEALLEGHRRVQNNDWDYAFAAVRFDYPIQRALRQLPDGGVAFVQPEMAAVRSQDLEPRYHDAGQFYWGQLNAFRERQPILGPRSWPVVLDSRDAQDIDTEDDWLMAESLFALRRPSEQT
ncbi:pseudaminic acid cytidylyltransferase [Saccharospirillum sp. MSK14-1]|uniref:pseudaminic acid cytidylyltransferase n=1 Tax=Saccharospirillum sp. MSK14-1 TaxID=1897632 RepID=UPI000D3D682C|nr:pseudaminic acid cytidylyltransferase [Saccharospirillum sp. MSK14-1]PTY36778.1 pseudaminic acid cytidylyltransferase [Saccharospirillum sp. MSK14-1]